MNALFTTLKRWCFNSAPAATAIPPPPTPTLTTTTTSKPVTTNTVVEPVVASAERSLLTLGDDILLDVLSLLSPQDITSVRKTCKYLSCVSQTRYLWHHILNEDVVKRRLPLPRYRKPHADLGSRELELLARHALSTETAASQPIIKRLDQAQQSITWVRFVNGQWLLVASRHVATKKNMLSMYRVSSMQRGFSEALVSAELPGPVSSGEVQVQDDQLVVALCFQAPERMVTIMSLRRTESGMMAQELARMPGVSHIKALRNDFIGCAVQGDMQSLCLANWRTGVITSMPALDKDARCLAMALREDSCTVVTPDTIQIYSVPANGEATLQQVLQLGHVAEHAAISKEAEAMPSHLASEDSQAQMLLSITNKTGVFVYRVVRDGSDSFAAEFVAAQEPAVAPNASQPSKPAYPCFGGSASRVAWIHPPASLFDRTSCLVNAQVSSSDDGPKLVTLAECRSAELPSLYALPVMDYDDGLGLLVVGNGFGHFALCSFSAPVPDDFHRCLQDIPIPAA